MHRLATIPDVTLAHRVLWKLQEAGIESIVTTEHPAIGLYSGVQQGIVWIADAHDEQRALELYNEVIDSRRQNRIECPNCHYSMDGHGGSVRCPECALEFHAEPYPLTCAQCNEQSPGNFETCWNCGAALVGH